MTAKIFCIDPPEEYTAPTLAGHRDSVLGAWFSKDRKDVSGVKDATATTGSSLSLHYTYLDIYCQQRRCSFPMEI